MSKAEAGDREVRKPIRSKCTEDAHTTRSVKVLNKGVLFQDKV